MVRCLFAGPEHSRRAVRVGHEENLGGELNYLLTSSRISDSLISVVDCLFIMPLRKPPTLTAARLTANRRNAQKSTGPRTEPGKARSRLNGLRPDGACRSIGRFSGSWLMPPCSVNSVVASHMLTLEEASHPVFASIVDLFRRMERGIFASFAPDPKPVRKNRF